MGGPDADAHCAGVEVVVHLLAGGFGGLAEYGDGEGLGVAAAFVGQGVQLAASVLDLGRGGAVGEPAVAPAGHPPEDIAGHAAEEDGRVGLLGGLGVHIDGREVVVLAVVFGLFLGPEGLEGGHGFAGLGPAVVEVAAHHFGFLAVPAGADAEDEASVAVLVQDGDLLGEDERVAFRHQGDAGAEFDAISDGGGHGEGDVGFGEVAVSPGDFAAGGGEGAGAVDGQDGVFVVPDGLEAQFLGFLGDEGRVEGVGGQGDDQSDGHRGLLWRNGRAG